MARRSPAPAWSSPVSPSSRCSCSPARLQKRRVPLLDLRTLSHRTFAVGADAVGLFLAMHGFDDPAAALPAGPARSHPPADRPAGGARWSGHGLPRPAGWPAFDRFGRVRWLSPGSAVVVAGSGSRQVRHHAVAVVLGAHVLLWSSLAALFTPVFTLSLGALPAHLYSHGSSLLGSTQQVSAAIGTAISVTILSSRTDIAAQGGSAPGPRRSAACNGPSRARADLPRRGRAGADPAVAGRRSVPRPGAGRGTRRLLTARGSARSALT